MTAKWFFLFIAVLAAEIGKLALSDGDKSPTAVLPAAAPALAAASIIYTLLLVWLARQSRFGKGQTFVILFAAVFGIQVVMTLIEIPLVGKALGYTEDGFLRDFSTSLPAVVIATGAAAFLFAPRASEAPGAGPHVFRPPASWAWRILTVALLYVLAYFLAGISIAWQSAAVREFYEGKIFVGPLTLVIIQVGRGVLWALLGLMLLSSLRSNSLTRVLALGAAFSLFMAVQLIYPNPYLPLNVRIPHFIEVTLSNFAFGVLAGLLLMPIVRGRTE